MSKYVDPEALTPDDVEYIRQRPQLRQEFILNGFGDPLAEDYPGLVGSDEPPSEGTPGPDSTSPEPGTEDPTEDDEESDSITLSEAQQWDQSMSKSSLEQVVEARNADRDPEGDWIIQPTGSNKGDLVTALQNDDRRIEEYNNSLGGE